MSVALLEDNFKYYGSWGCRFFIDAGKTKKEYHFLNPLQYSIISWFLFERNNPIK
jgi:hypothetical protein